MRESTIMLSLATVAGALAPATAPPGSGNLNGFRYGVANAPQLGRNFSLRSRSERFVDVFTPVISSLYSQVQWSPHFVGLPPDLVAEFDGRVMNIVGYEFNIVRPRDISQPCVSSTSAHPTPCEWTSVPSFEQYNHHYGTTVTGKGTAYVKTGIPSTDPMMSHTGGVEGYELVTDEDAPNLHAPTSQLLMMGNGAESRHTLKVFPKAFGALVGSPTGMTINPMIIDTNSRGNRSSVPGAPKVPGRHGPVPQSSNVGPGEMYSGIMECPCTDAFPKVVASSTTLASGKCAGTSLMSSADKCFAAAVSLGLDAKTNVSVHTQTAPPGCYATAISGGFEVAFNSMASSTHECGTSSSSSSSSRSVAMIDPSKGGACASCALDLSGPPGAVKRH
jgi:hypothetical protein